MRKNEAILDYGICIIVILIELIRFWPIELNVFFFFISIAFDYSGGYYNPVLATGLKFGCKGHTNIEHVIVYWIGASLGAIASIFVYPTVRKGMGIKEKIA